MVNENQFGSRDKKGHWRPFSRVDYGPLFRWPSEPMQLFKWLFRWDGYIFPWNFIYALVAVLVWTYFTPPMETMKSFSIDWIAYIAIRNGVLMTLWYGAFHLWLYVRRNQGTTFKYNPKWPETDNSAFLFKNQTIDNLIWCFASGLPIWTAFEVITLWMMSNGYIPYLNLDTNPILFFAIFLFLPLFREVHFYCIHRLIHWPPLYRTVHKVHHANSNPGPWSGLSMHPVEHLFYFSGVIIHWIIPSHPVHALFHLVHLVMSPTPGHAGFDKVIIGDKKLLETHCFAHYLHHKYFEVNYADGSIPLDKWFGTFHDGSDKGDQLVKARLKGLKEKST